MHGGDCDFVCSLPVVLKVGDLFPQLDLRVELRDELVVFFLLRKPLKNVHLAMQLRLRRHRHSRTQHEVRPGAQLCSGANVRVKIYID